ncbi:hypothetical protein OAG71_04885 [bacterium]|nr:hypothetical protein [bacterium]
MKNSIDGGSYYSMMIQLPAKIRVGDELTVSPFHTPKSNAVREIREMNSGTMIAKQFGNPDSWSLDGTSINSTGKIIVKELNKDSVKIHVMFDLTLEDNQLLNVDETLEIDRGYPKSPFETEQKIAR